MRICAEGVAGAMNSKKKLIAFAACIFWTAPTVAQDVDGDGTAIVKRGDTDAEPAKPATPEIVVTAERLPGSVDTDVLPLQVLSPADIAAYGASSLGDLMSRLKPNTRSSGGRGDQAPVMLINGRRASDANGLSSLPPEAILRFEIYPEKVALEQGFSAGQRVVNIVLQKSYASTTVDIGAGGASAGNYGDRDAEVTLFQIEGDARLNLSAKYSKSASISEEARGIIDSLPGGSANNGRTLVPDSDSASITGSYARPIGRQTNFTLSFGTSRTKAKDVLGYAQTASLLPPLIQEPFAAQSKTKSANAGVGLTGKLGDWLWSTDAKWNRTLSSYVSDRDSGSFAPQTDSTNNVSQLTSVETTLGGTVITLPAGKGRVQFQISGDLDEISSSSYLDNILSLTNLSRRRITAGTTVEIPITSREKNILPVIGDWSFTGRIATRNYSDAGNLPNWTFALNWSPIKRLSLISTWTGELEAPSLSQLGSPTRLTPFRVIYDFVRGETAFASVISGGSPSLRPERKRDFKLQLNWKPPTKTEADFTVAYSNLRATNSTVSAPLFTQAIEAALPGRVVRGADGRITSIDQRDYNTASEIGEMLNATFNVMKRFGKPPAFGNWTLNVNYRLRLRDERLIRAGFPVLDFHNGAAYNFMGGLSRHEVDASAFWYRGGKGVFIYGSWRDKSRVFDDSLGQVARGSRLDFSSLLTLNLYSFFDLDASAKLLKSAPFLKGTRLSISINNLLGNAMEVRDENRLIPLSYQRGYLDPTGRSIKINLRKQF